MANRTSVAPNSECPVAPLHVQLVPSEGKKHPWAYTIAMKRVILVCVALSITVLVIWIGSAPLSAQVAMPAGAWRQTNVTWKKPPAELQLKERYAEAAVLYFSPDQKFLLLYATVIQQPKSEQISEGDGCVLYLGTWKPTGNHLDVEYRLVSRTIAKEGETLPGPVQTAHVWVRDSAVLFQKDRFVQDKNLDNHLKAVLQEESARPGMSCVNP